MKNRTSAHVLYGLATGLFVWSIHELWIYLFPTVLTPGQAEKAISSILIGVGFAVFALAKSGYFADNSHKVKRGVIYGAVLGLAGGICGFILIDQVDSQLSEMALPPLLIQAMFAVRWLILSLFIGIGAGLRDRSSTIMTRALIGSGIAGLVCGIIITGMNAISPLFFATRGIGFVLFGIALSLSLDHLSVFGRKAWIRGLNGRLEGLEFELLQEIHCLGTQSNDDINLKSYQDIRPSHAKLVRYYSGYSLVDNDPFWQTYVNFRNIKEQPLKNGDIIKVGRALFQYCTVS